MCFIVSKKEGYSEAKVAEENIVCYKYLEKGLKAPYRSRFTYKVGKVYPKVKLVVNERVELVGVKYSEIYEGYHSYSEKAFKGRDRELFYHPYYKCIIPAGSRYYENPEYGEYVSDSIILTTDQPLSWEEGVALMGLDKKINQEEFNTFFTELIQNGVKRKDTSDTHYILYDENGEWLFDVNQDSKNPYFWYSYNRIHPLFEGKFGVNECQVSWLMQPTLETHFKMRGVTPIAQIRAKADKLETHFKMRGVTPTRINLNIGYLLEEHFKLKWMVPVEHL